MRHAKSDYPEGVGDHERPLADRGIREAGLAGEWLRANFPVIDAVLCSSATRTRQTLGRTAVDAPTEFLDRLYGASPGEVIDEIKKVGDDVSTLLVVGHEPTMRHLALGLLNPATWHTVAPVVLVGLVLTAVAAVLPTLRRRAMAGLGS